MNAMSRRMVHFQTKIASELMKLKSHVRPDWVDAGMTVEGLRDLITLAIAKKDWRTMVALYAAAIVMDRRQANDGGFPWADVAAKVQKRFWYVPNVMSILKRDAWKHIYDAKARQTSQGVRIRPSPDVATGRDLAPAWRILGAVASNAVAVGLGILGVLIVARFFWAVAFWMMNPQYGPAEVMILAANLGAWGI